MSSESAALLTASEVTVAVDAQVLLPTTSLSLDSGQALAVRGSNGAGKTTLLRVLAGLMPATSGSVTLRGDPLHIRRGTHRAAIAAMIDPPRWREISLSLNNCDSSARPGATTL